jgi:hypothetical protein
MRWSRSSDGIHGGHQARGARGAMAVDPRLWSLEGQPVAGASGLCQRLRCRAVRVRALCVVAEAVVRMKWARGPGAWPVQHLHCRPPSAEGRRCRREGEEDVFLRHRPL